MSFNTCLSQAHVQSPPEFMIAQMLYAGVDHCILQAGGGYGAMNDYNAFAHSQYPGTFTSLLHIDEAVADREDVLGELIGRIGRSASMGFTTHTTFRGMDMPGTWTTRLSDCFGIRLQRSSFWLSSRFWPRQTMTSRVTSPT